MKLGQYTYDAINPPLDFGALGPEAYNCYTNMWGCCDIFMYHNIFQPWCCNEAIP